MEAGNGLSLVGPQQRILCDTSSSGRFLVLHDVDSRWERLDRSTGRRVAIAFRVFISAATNLVAGSGTPPRVFVHGA